MKNEVSMLSQLYPVYCSSNWHDACRYLTGWFFLTLISCIQLIFFSVDFMLIYFKIINVFIFLSSFCMVSELWCIITHYDFMFYGSSFIWFLTPFKQAKFLISYTKNKYFLKIVILYTSKHLNYIIPNSYLFII